MSIFPTWIGDSFYEGTGELVLSYADKLELMINTNDTIKCEIMEEIVECQINEENLIITLE